MGAFSEPKKVGGSPPVPNILGLDEIEKWLLTPTDYAKLFKCMLYGADGTGKSGIALDFLTEEDIAEGKKIVIIDLDAGNVPLIAKYHKDKIKNIILKNPLAIKIENGDVATDYKLTFARIKAIINWINLKHKEYKIKAVIFDGLSTALKHAEYQMRIERHLTIDGGVNQSYWKLREKLFSETISAIKSLPINSFFIAHEDFIAEEQERDLAMVKQKTNQEMHQKIKCVRKDTGDKIIFKAIIDKSKYRVDSEGKEIIFCEINKETKKVKWQTKEIFECLL